MSRSIAVILAHEDVLSAAVQQLPGAIMCATPHQMGPMQPARSESFTSLTSSLELKLAEWSLAAPVACVEDAYFGGVGRQSCVLFKNGARVLGPLTHDSTPGTRSPQAQLKADFRLSVGWDGRLFDCDFNQMLDLAMAGGSPRTIHDLSEAVMTGRTIAVGPHGYSCTAGQGSSCGGATAAP